MITVYTFSFFDWYTPGQLVTGGMENYALALCHLLRKMGREVALYQWAHYEEERSYEGIPVVVREIKGRSTFEMTAEMERWAGPEIIYVWLGTQLRYRPGNITISHGIWWDCDNAGPGRVDEVKKYILAALEGCRAIVSVDTNFLNWVRASLPGHAGNIVYVPNFVDTARFRPEEPAGAALRPATGRTEVSRAVLLYPRRVSAERGTATMMGLASRFLEAYPGVEVVFAGVGNRQSQDYRDFLNWLSGHPHRDRIRHIAAGPEEMPGIYRQADIVVIPSPCCEGTSLSCLEAMATGKAVVATNVGGLPNLILDGYNGLLVTPDQASVGEAVDRLIRDPGLCRRLGEKARETSQVFCLERWEERWARLIERVYGKRGG